MKLNDLEYAMKLKCDKDEIVDFLKNVDACKSGTIRIAGLFNGGYANVPKDDLRAMLREALVTINIELIKLGVEILEGEK